MPWSVSAAFPHPAHRTPGFAHALRANRQFTTGLYDSLDMAGARLGGSFITGEFAHGTMIDACSAESLPI